MDRPRDTLEQAKASACHVVDTCVLDGACPFADDCREAEAPCPA